MSGIRHMTGHAVTRIKGALGAFVPAAKIFARFNSDGNISGNKFNSDAKHGGMNFNSQARIEV